MTTGSYLGEIEILAGISRITETKAGANLDLLTIRKSNFVKILKEYPEYANHVHRIALKRYYLLKDSIRKIKKLIPMSKKALFWFQQRK